MEPKQKGPKRKEERVKKVEERRAKQRKEPSPLTKIVKKVPRRPALAVLAMGGALALTWPLIDAFRRGFNAPDDKDFIHKPEVGSLDASQQYVVDLIEKPSQFDLAGGSATVRDSLIEVANVMIDQDFQTGTIPFDFKPFSEYLRTGSSGHTDMRLIMLEEPTVDPHVAITDFTQAPEFLEENATGKDHRLGQLNTALNEFFHYSMMQEESVEMDSSIILEGGRLIPTDSTPIITVDGSEAAYYLRVGGTIVLKTNEGAATLAGIDEFFSSLYGQKKLGELGLDDISEPEELLMDCGLYLYQKYGVDLRDDASFWEQIEGLKSPDFTQDLVDLFGGMQAFVSYQKLLDEVYRGNWGYYEFIREVEKIHIEQSSHAR